MNLRPQHNIQLSKATRVIGVEFLQNWPVLIGLMFSLKADRWLFRLLWMVVGATATAALIAFTERIKLDRPADYRERPSDLLVNAASFFAGGMLYVLYHFFIRTGFDVSSAGDIAFGAVMGLAVGASQALFVSSRRINRYSVGHALALAVAATVIVAVVGLLSDILPPFLAATILCIPMTLIIVSIDYWSLIIPGAAAL